LLRRTRESSVRLYQTGNINPDLYDGRSNTGLMLASIRDKICVIAMLTKCGAKVDAMNDEDLTPLTIYIYIYFVVVSYYLGTSPLYRTVNKKII
jgi:hypothetical protein